MLTLSSGVAAGPGLIDEHAQDLLAAFALQFDIENIEAVCGCHSLGQLADSF